jgi:hypothetical protein
MQALQRKHHKEKNKVIYGYSDEIDAYGINIACELLHRFNNDTDKVIEYLNEDKVNEEI